MLYYILVSQHGMGMALDVTVGNPSIPDPYQSAYMPRHLVDPNAQECSRTRVCISVPQSRALSQSGGVPSCADPSLILTSEAGAGRGPVRAIKMGQTCVAEEGQESRCCITVPTYRQYRGAGQYVFCFMHAVCEYAVQT